MNHREPEHQFLDELDEIARQGVVQILDDEPNEDRMQATIERAVTLSEQSKVELVPPRSFYGKYAWVGIAVAMLTAFGFAWIFLLQAKPSFAAEIAQSIAAQDWVRTIESATAGDGQAKSENIVTWFSKSRDVSARIDEDTIEFRDHVAGEFQIFSRAEETIYRVSESDFPIRYSRFSELATSLPILLARDLEDNPLDTLPLFSDFDERVSFVGHQLNQSESGDSVQYAIQFILDANPAEMVFVVHPDSKLPLSCEASITNNGVEMTWSTRFEYPESGPSNIYDLEVPIDANVVDRVESVQAKFLLEAVRAGAEAFDDYRAVSVSYRLDDKVWWVNADVEILCRKGDRLSRSFCFLEYDRADFKSKPPETEPELERWWRKRLKERQPREFRPDGQLSGLMIGDQEWSVRFREDGTADFEKHRFKTDMPGFYSLLPEYKARPPMGGSARNMAINVDESPRFGPEGTILFELIQTLHPDVTPIKHVGDREPAASWRYWIDPERGYLVVRREFVDAEGNWTDCTIVEKSKKSPGGVWYPTQTLRRSRHPDGKINEKRTKFYLDFDVDVADEHFKVD